MGSEARTRLGLASLLAVSLFSFSQVFADGEYPGPAALGMIIAASLAILFRRFGISVLMTGIVSLVAMVTYLSFIFETKHTFYGIPTPDAVRRLIDSSTHALERSQIDFAPVPVRPGYVILLVAGLWLAAALGEIATFRWRKPLIASLLPVILFSVVMIVGSGTGTPLFVGLFLAALLTYWGVESSHRMRSWGRWVPTWGDHEVEEEPDSITGEVARKMGATCVAIALIAPIFLPTLGDGLLSWRNQVSGDGPGTGGGGRIDPLVSIAPTVLNQSDRELFIIKADSPEYWRLLTLTDFDGERWTPSGGDLAEIRDGAIEGPVSTSASAETLVQTVTITGLVSDALPAAVQATDIELVTQDNIEGDLRFDAETGDIRVTSELGGALVYDVSSVVASETYPELLAAQIGELGGDYTNLPDRLSPEVVALLDDWTADAELPFEKLIAIQSHLRSDDFTYSLDIDQIKARQVASTDELTNFLINSRTGYCQQFSTAFALLARQLGYASRLVVGFLPGEASDDGTEYTVRGTDAHSWPEVYFEGVGWVAFEPTPRADLRTAIAPSYTNPEGDGNGGVLGSDGTNVPGPNGGGGGQLDDPRLLGAGDDPGAADGNPAALNDLRNQGAGASNDRPPAAWERTFGRVTFVLIGAFVLFFLSIPLLKEARIRKSYRDSDGGRDLASAAFFEFVSNARELAAIRGAGESPTSYTQRVAEVKGIPERAALRLAFIYEAAQYSSHETSDSEATEAQKLAKGLRRNMWSRSTLWQRAARLFSPTSLSLHVPKLRMPRFSGRRAAV